jgi:hypothetical protein
LRDFLLMLARAALAILAASRAALARVVARLSFREREQAGAIRFYRNALDRLSGRGWPRRAHETPREYAARLEPQWPGPGGDMAMMTRAFEHERYGGRKRGEGRLRRLFRKLRRSINAMAFRREDDAAS